MFIKDLFLPVTLATNREAYQRSPSKICFTICLCISPDLDGYRYRPPKMKQCLHKLDPQRQFGTELPDPCSRMLQTTGTVSQECDTSNQFALGIRLCHLRIGSAHPECDRISVGPGTLTSAGYNKPAGLPRALRFLASATHYFHGTGPV